MKKVTGYFVEQNIGVIDRIVRVLIGVAMLGYPYFLIVQPNATVEMWQSIMMVLSIYPSLTGILGAEPLYSLVGVKTCGLSGRNRCGSFPYQVDALMGRDPHPENDLEHTLLHSSHIKHA